MRVRHLQSNLAEKRLIHPGKLDSIRGLRLGVDAVYWLRSISSLKDPFADALGGVPPGIFGCVDKELDHFRRNDITPVFVFQGIAPSASHVMFNCRIEQHMELVWTLLVQGQRQEAEKYFAVSTSRINSDFVFFIFHHLRQRGFEVVQAPYFAGAQLTHFIQDGIVNTIFGPPGLLLYGPSDVIVYIDFQHHNMEWVGLEEVLNKWQINKDQFIDACMLAGTEYCLTYPYFNLLNSNSAQGSNSRCNVDVSVNVIKQAPLINWMQTFPSEEMKNDHIESYCVCKVLVQHSPVLSYTENRIMPLSNSGAQGPPLVPCDFEQIVGQRLPNSLYYLMLQGAISHKLPQALARGEWTDKSQPLVETAEYRNFVEDLQEYRRVALGLIARHLCGSFAKKEIVCKAFWDARKQGSGAPAKQRVITPATLTTVLRWRITTDALQVEMERQGVDRIDFKFCLQWHAHEYQTEGPLVQDFQKPGDPTCSDDPLSLSALIHFMILEHLGMIADDGDMTVLGNQLKDFPTHVQEPCLIALEMMKFGVLNGEPFESVPEMAFPEQVNYPKQPVEPWTKSVLLICRVTSLVPMRLRTEYWNADVDFDLAAFHSLVRLLKRTMRQLTEASLASVLLKDMNRVKLLPPGFMSASPPRVQSQDGSYTTANGDPLFSDALLPTFMLPRACMGIVCQFFLWYTGRPDRFLKDLHQQFPCCLQPREDLKLAFAFWEDLRLVIDAIAEPLGVEELQKDMEIASQMLRKQQERLDVKPEAPPLRRQKDWQQRQHQQYAPPEISPGGSSGARRHQDSSSSPMGMDDMAKDPAGKGQQRRPPEVNTWYEGALDGKAPDVDAPAAAAAAASRKKMAMPNQPQPQPQQGPVQPQTATPKNQQQQPVQSEGSNPGMPRQGFFAAPWEQQQEDGRQRTPMNPEARSPGGMNQPPQDGRPRTPLNAGGVNQQPQDGGQQFQQHSSKQMPQGQQPPQQQQQKVQQQHQQQQQTPQQMQQPPDMQQHQSKFPVDHQQHQQQQQHQQYQQHHQQQQQPQGHQQNRKGGGDGRQQGRGKGGKRGGAGGASGGDDGGKGGGSWSGNQNASGCYGGGGSNNNNSNNQYGGQQGQQQQQEPQSNFGGSGGGGGNCGGTGGQQYGRPDGNPGWGNCGGFSSRGPQQQGQQTPQQYSQSPTHGSLPSMDGRSDNQGAFKDDYGMHDSGSYNVGRGFSGGCNAPPEQSTGFAGPGGGGNYGCAGRQFSGGCSPGGGAQSHGGFSGGGCGGGCGNCGGCGGGYNSSNNQRQYSGGCNGTAPDGGSNSMMGNCGGGGGCGGCGGCGGYGNASRQFSGGCNDANSSYMNQQRFASGGGQDSYTSGMRQGSDGFNGPQDNYNTGPMGQFQGQSGNSPDGSSYSPQHFYPGGNGDGSSGANFNSGGYNQNRQQTGFGQGGHYQGGTGHSGPYHGESGHFMG